MYNLWNIYDFEFECVNEWVSDLVPGLGKLLLQLGCLVKSSCDDFCFIL